MNTEPPKEPSAVIRVKGLYKIYRVGETKVRALNGVSFEIPKGEFVAIVGTSGSGKSTLLKLLTGVLKAEKGHILVDGQEIKGVTEHFAYMPQNDLLFPWKTILENVCLYGRIHGSADGMKEQARKQIIDELFVKDENGQFFISKIGITAGYSNGYAAMIEDNEWSKIHKKYNVMLERKLRMNFRLGYWEIAFYHTKPLSCVPKDMRMC